MLFNLFWACPNLEQHKIVYEEMAVSRHFL
jgi:hypothetical protein